MHFAQPYWLLSGLVAVAVAATLLVRSEHLRTRALALLGDARLGGTAPSRLRRWVRVAVTTAAVSMAFVALARPQHGLHWETLERNGIDLLLVVDTSKSMDADDVKPTRLERTKLAIRDLVERFPGDRVGLVAFAGDAFVESPMTLDHGALLEAVDNLDTNVIARGGTNIGRGIDVAAAALANEPARQKVMVLLSDGEDLEGQGLREARSAASAGIVIDTLGVGTAAGELVPAHDARGRTVGVVRDLDGTVVRSHLDEPGLRAIAEAAHGTYRPLGADGLGLDHLYAESLAGLTHAEASSRTRRVYSELFELPLGLALFGVVLDAILARRWRSSPRRGRPAAGPRRAPILATAAAALLATAPMPALASVTSANRSYAAGRFEEATAEFLHESAKNPKDARLAFNAGDAAYRAGHLDVADAAFKSALEVADPQLQQRVLYNDGNVLYRAGQSLKPDARDEIIVKWKAAVAAYDGALALDAKDADARFNRDLVARKLKALEEQKKKDEDMKPKDTSNGGADTKSPKDGNDKGGSSGSGGKGDPKRAGDSGAQPRSGSRAGKDEARSPSQPAGSPNRATPSSSDTPDPQGKSNGGQPSGPPPASGSGIGQGPQGGAPPSGPPQLPGEHAGETAQGMDGARPEPGRLSPRDARALLGALRGDERRSLVRGAAESAPSDDAPRKDW